MRTLFKGGFEGYHFVCAILKDMDNPRELIPQYDVLGTIMQRHWNGPISDDILDLLQSIPTGDVRSNNW